MFVQVLSVLPDFPISALVRADTFYDAFGFKVGKMFFYGFG